MELPDVNYFISKLRNICLEPNEGRETPRKDRAGETVGGNHTGGEKASVEKLQWEYAHKKADLKEREIEYANIQEQIEELDEVSEPVKEIEKIMPVYNLP